VNVTITVNIYYIVNGGSRLTLTLPTTSAAGDVFRVVDLSGNGWRIGQNTGQNMRYLSATTTTGTGGYIDSISTGGTAEFVCTVANTTWTATSGLGTVNVV